MAIDVSLVLDVGQTLTADQNTDYIEVEGGFLCWAKADYGAMTGAATTLDSRVMYSPDLGVTYYMAPGGKFRQLGPTDDNKDDRIPVYIPPPTTAGNKVRVRMNYDVAGASPSYIISNVRLEPMTSLAPPDVDVSGAIGCCRLLTGL